MKGPPPEVIADRYELGTQLGSGGTAAVYRVFDRVLRVERALKVLTVAPRYRAGLRRRLEREAQAMAALDDPHLLRVYDVGADGELDYVVMDLAEGGSLADVLDGYGPMPPATALAYTIHLLAALDAAHEARVIHRDVKPQNILLSRDNVARLADFGIALLDREDIERHTRVGAMMGSLAYMAPEQRQDARAVGPEADLYAAGCTLYNLLTGASPLDLFLASESSPRWMGVPPAIQALLRRATRPDPAERHCSAQELARDVAQLLPTMPNNRGPVHPPEEATQAALRRLLRDAPRPASAPPRLLDEEGLDGGITWSGELGTDPSPHPLTVVPDQDEIGPTLSPPTQLPDSAPAPPPRAVLALLALAGLGALGVGAAQLRSAPEAVLAEHRALSISAPSTPAALASPRRAIREALSAQQTERYRTPPPAPAPAQASRPAAPAGCAAYPPGAGSSPASGTWKGMRTIPQGAVNVTLTLGGPPSAISGCALVTFFGETTAYPARGALSGSKLTLREGNGYRYTLTVTDNNMQGSFVSGQGQIPASFVRSR